MAAIHYCQENALDAKVVLHETLEDALDVVLTDRDFVLLGCIVYPDLHNIVFSTLKELKLKDIFLLDTYEMVLATRVDFEGSIDCVASHPAPKNLVPNGANIELCSSNAKAASMCSKSEVDACITTSKAANKYNLKVITDFGKVKMGFSIHEHK
ncbi:hypothetical protein [Spartinivicinus poritis]|uniref:Prephenate dehydratase n=1 Tax=Spartinivicinus poritis TaxID=2994640 RepID=A0ABT5U8K5_9GAMM|nr:hypothetical protein [Spartinivicinus sp. A2-2]MDE1462525.1 hypothetical protein [Spartinivicinus sp. A2-2]